MRLGLLICLLAVGCGGAEFTTEPPELLEDPRFDAGTDPAPEASAPDGELPGEGGEDSSDAAGDADEASTTDAGADAPVEPDAGVDAPVGHCGVPFPCGDGGAIETPPAVCAYYPASGEYSGFGAGPGCGTCATNTCACIEAAWLTTNQACSILSCDDSNGQVRVTCR